MKKRLTLLLVILFSVQPFLFAKETNPPYPAELLELKQAVLKDILSTSIKEEEIVKLAAEMQPDGSWAAIDYTDKTRGGWPVANHLNQLLHMAILFNRAGTPLQNDPVLKEKILLGLAYWWKNDFINPNWWQPQINVPKLLGAAMLLMESHLTDEDKKAGLKILSRSKIGMTGQNKVWLSGNVIYRSLLTGEVEPVKAAVKAIQEEMVVSEGEGIQADQSYHQHGPQQQFGNYGLHYATDMLKWAAIFQTTPFRFSQEKVVILRNFLLHGMRWVIWKNEMDISACGRQLFPQSQVNKAQILTNVYAKMPFVDPAYQNEYQQAFNDFSGNKHFWRSDMTVHRRDHFYASVKMVSSRVAGAESCNFENVQGYHLGDGATYFYQSNKEYNDIFPFWDWKMIPGTTTFHGPDSLPVLPCEGGYHIESDFVGGVSNGTNGVATLAYNRDKLTAKKSYFFFDDAVICLGAGISTTEAKEVRTTINQSFLHGSVQVRTEAHLKTLPEGQHSLPSVSWIVHDNWGYFFPKGMNVELTNREQTGQWNHLLKRIPPKEIKANLFTLYINHQLQPADADYAYFVFPKADANTMAARGAAISVVQNSKERQVIEIAKKQMAGFVFYTAGEAATKSFHTVSVNKPCVMMMDKKSAAVQVTIADPTHKLTSITIGISGRKKCTTMPSTYDAAGNRTLFTVSLPQGSEAGRSIMFTVL